MANMPTGRDRDERVSLVPLDPKEALRALLAVDPDDEPDQPEVNSDGNTERGAGAADC